MGSISLSGKRVLITGGGGGVGLATARMLVDEGAELLLTDRSAATLVGAAEELGKAARITTFAADLSCGAEVAELFAQVDSELGGLEPARALAPIRSWILSTTVGGTSSKAIF